DAASDGWIHFLSSRPEEEHHQVALAPGRDVPPGAKLMQQVSFIVEDVKALKEYYQRLKQEGVRIERTVSHGISMSLYCYDPDDNRIELYAKMPYKTPYSVPQPFSEPIDLDLPEEELLAVAGRAGKS
ncbi:MAG: VOC family protein, partial [Dehalococcoidia bacterium]